MNSHFPFLLATFFDAANSFIRSLRSARSTSSATSSGGGRERDLEEVRHVDLGGREASFCLAEAILEMLVRGWRLWGGLRVVGGLEGMVVCCVGLCG